MKQAINQETMRANNKKSILEHIRKNAPVSKPQLAENLGLSSTSVATFIQELMDEAKIINYGIAKSTGGRRSLLYQINPAAFYIIGIDLQVDRIIVLLADATGKVLLSKEKEFTNKNEWYVIDLLTELIDGIIAENKIAPEKIGGIGIGVPGIVQNATGLIEFAPNLGWSNVNLKQLLPYKKPVLVENEANAAAIGEKAYGAASKTSNYIYISIGVGIGCGLVFNGKLFPGESNHAGEFGHMTVDPAGIACRCGNQGCWEAYASEEAAVKLYNQISGEPVRSYKQLLDLISANDQTASGVMESVIKYLGIGIANLVNGLNPEMIIIGGKIALIKDSIYNKIIKHIKERCMDKSFSGVNIQFSNLKDQAAALGMVNLVIDHIIQD